MRRQFSIRVCFTMGVNKSQRQSLALVGVDLCALCFSHGQLNLTLAQVTDDVRLALRFKENGPEINENVVYPEVLLPT